MESSISPRLDQLYQRLVREDIEAHYDDMQDALIVGYKLAIHEDLGVYYVLFKAQAMQTEIAANWYHTLGRLFLILAEENANAE